MKREREFEASHPDIIDEACGTWPSMYGYAAIDARRTHSAVCWKPINCWTTERTTPGQGHSS